MKKKFRVGVIGCGGIATAHVWGIINSPDLEIGALCDIVPEKLEEKKRQCGASDDMLFDDYIKMIESGKVDAVDICTPNNLHFEMAMEAVKHGLPYSVEKPVCLCKEDAATLLEETKKKNILNMVCFSYRFISAARYARDLVQSGDLGGIYQISGEYFQDCAPAKNGHGAPLIWRFDKKIAGSGALGDLGSHMIDLIRFIMGRDFTRISADYDTLVRTRPHPSYDGRICDVLVDDYIDMIGQVEGNVGVNMSISRFAYGRGNYQRIEVYGEKGALRYTLDNVGKLEVNIGNDPMRQAHIWCDVPVPQKYDSNQAQSFADILNGCGDGLAATIEDGWKSHIVMDAALLSAKNAIKL